MTTWKIFGFSPIPNSIIMEQKEWSISADSFEDVIDIAEKQGIRNIFKIEQVQTTPEQ